MIEDVLSKRAKRIKPSPTLKISSLAKQMKSEGQEVINFGVGEPDFDTPNYIKEEAHKALDENFTRYTATAGINELKNAVVQKYKNDFGLEYSPEQVLVSPGAKASIVFNLMAICDKDDEVIITAPYWVSYPSEIELADGIPVIINTEEKEDFKLNPQVLQDTIKNLKNPKAIILNSPNNPTGTVYKKEELMEICQICVDHNLVIIADEIYEKLIYDNLEHTNIASLSDEIKERTIIINGVSKAYAMTGWRLGYSVGPLPIIKSAARIQGHTTSCVNTITQKAAVKALTFDDGSLDKMREEFEKRRDYLVEKLNEIPHVKCNLPHGAFYAMPNIGYYLQNNNKGIKNSTDLCDYLLKNYHIAIVPGAAFGMENNVRFSYATSMQNIEKGLEYFSEGLASLL